VSSPELAPVRVVKVAQSRQARLRGEGDRTARRSRDDGAIIGGGRRRAARLITAELWRAIASSQAPVGAAVGKLDRRNGTAIGLLRQGSTPRILEVRAVVRVHETIG